MPRHLRTTNDFDPRPRLSSTVCLIHQYAEAEGAMRVREATCHRSDPRRSGEADVKVLEVRSVACRQYAARILDCREKVRVARGGKGAKEMSGAIETKSRKLLSTRYHQCCLRILGLPRSHRFLQTRRRRMIIDNASRHLLTSKCNLEWRKHRGLVEEQGKGTERN